MFVHVIAANVYSTQVEGTWRHTLSAVPVSLHCVRAKAGNPNWGLAIRTLSETTVCLCCRR